MMEEGERGVSCATAGSPWPGNGGGRGNMRHNRGRTASLPPAVLPGGGDEGASGPLLVPTAGDKGDPGASALGAACVPGGFQRREEASKSTAQPLVTGSGTQTNCREIGTCQTPQSVPPPSARGVPTSDRRCGGTKCGQA